MDNAALTRTCARRRNSDLTFHANPGIFDHVTELGVSASYDLPDVDYGREESTEGAYKWCAGFSGRAREP